MTLLLRTLFLNFVLISCANSAPVDDIVASHFKNRSFADLYDDIERGVVPASYLFPDGSPLLQLLLVFGEEDLAITILGEHWAELKYLSGLMVDEACLNGRPKFFEFILDQGGLNQEEAPAVIDYCLSQSIERMDIEMIRIVLDAGEVRNVENLELDKHVSRVRENVSKLKSIEKILLDLQ